MISEPAVRPADMHQYLVSIDQGVWGAKMLAELFPDGARDHTQDAQLLTEFMGRICYRSWSVSANRNLTRIRHDRDDYLLNIIRSGHGNVLECANFSFVISDLTRVCAAELARHRAGVSISEMSLRYVRLDDLRFRLPPGITDNNRRRMVKLIEATERTMTAMIADEELDDKDFNHKKTITSALRRVAPLGLCTQVGLTANVRALRHMISMRTDVHAEEEIRVVFQQIARLMKTRCPALFGDMEEDESGAFKTDNWKV